MKTNAKVSLVPVPAPRKSWHLNCKIVIESILRGQTAMNLSYVAFPLLALLSSAAFAGTCGHIVDIPRIEPKGFTIIYDGDTQPFEIKSNPYNIGLLISSIGSAERDVCLGSEWGGPNSVSGVRMLGEQTRYEHKPSDFSRQVCGTVIEVIHAPAPLEKPFGDQNFDANGWVTLKVMDLNDAKAKGIEELTPANNNMPSGANAQVLVSVYDQAVFLPALGAAVGNRNVELCFTPDKQGVTRFTGARPVKYVK